MIKSNLMGPYPKGVPSPYVAHVHPYPTRFHGPIYTRPVFGFPWVESPQAVFKPNDFTPYGDEGPDRETGTAGLGDLQYNTGRGVFRPGGRGGGIFDTTLAGLGAAMSNGILSGGGSMGVLAAKQKKKTASKAMRGLGATPEIPWQCWDKAGFKVCHDSNYAVAQQRCGSADHLKTYGYASAADCIADEVYYADKANCGCSEMKTAASAPATGNEIHWNTPANIKAGQTKANTLLAESGYCPITVDGKLGPGTCGALRKLQSLGKGSAPPSACTSFRDPALKSTGCGSGGGSSAPAIPGVPSVSTPTVSTPATSPVDYASMGGGSNKTLWFALAGAATFGALYLWTKRKK